MQLGSFTGGLVSVQAEAPRRRQPRLAGIGDRPVVDRRAVSPRAEVELTARLGNERDLVQGGHAVDLVLGHLDAVDEEVAAIAGRQGHSHLDLAQVQVAVGWHDSYDGVAGLFLGRPRAAREGVDEACHGDYEQDADDQRRELGAQHVSVTERQRRGSWARGNRCDDANSRAMTLAAKANSTRRSGSAMPGPNTAAKATLNSQSSRARKAHAWRRRSIQQIGYLRARTVRNSGRARWLP